MWKHVIMVVLLYSDISNFTFQNVKNLKCKNFLIDFLDELGNFKQKNFYTSKCNFFYILQQQTLWLLYCIPVNMIFENTTVFKTFATLIL